MKRSIKSILLLAALVLLVGGYRLTQYLTQTQTVTEETGAFALTDRAEEELTGIAWTADGVDYHFVFEYDLWVNADDSAFPADQDSVQALADKLYALEASRKLEDVQSMADYGLDEPAFTVTGEWSDGTTTEYAMGDETPFGDGWYLKLSGDETVYTVASSLSTMFNKTLLDLAQLEDIPTVENADRLVVGDALELVYSEDSSSLDPDQRWFSADGTELENDSVEALISDANSIAWNELVTASATGEELTEWSLTDDAATALTVYEGGEPTLSLRIGATDEDGNYYARLSDSLMVYTVSADSLTALLEANAEGLVRTDLVPLAYDDLAEAEFTSGGEVLSFVRTETEVPVEADESDETDETETDETETTIEVSVTLNGSETDESQFESLWQLVHGLTLSETVETADEGEEMLTLRATSESGVSETFRFCEYDADSYQVIRSDGSCALTNADSIDKLIRTLRQMG